MIVSFVGLGRGITTSTAGRGGVVLTIKSRKYTIHKKIFASNFTFSGAVQ